MPRPNAFYGHFICMGGLAAIKAGRRFKVPSFLASGESSLDSPYRLGHRRLRRELSSVTGIVSVSEARKFELLENELVREERIDVFPNGVDHSLFYPHNRTEMRRRLNLPLDRFVVVFVGHFIQRKGARRLATAVQGLENTSVLFIGAGSEPPNSSQALFQGMVPHEKLPQYLSAADIFVLPTLAEGSCNAILEAMSCGLPIVSSEGDFNAGVVTDDVGIRVPPLDISAIHSAIKLLRDRPDLRHEMAVAALSKSKKYNLFARAQKISIFMNSRIALSGG
jgi:glycosyltransferase involved in cell wall biosynthesis